MRQNVCLEFDNSNTAGHRPDTEKSHAVKIAFFGCHGPLLTQLGVKNVWKDFARGIEKKIAVFYL